MIGRPINQDSEQARRTAGPLLWLLGLLALGLLVAGCGQAAVSGKPAREGVRLSPLVADSPLPTPAPGHTPTAIPWTPWPTVSPGQLVLLHTNDNWGETEPCG